MLRRQFLNALLVLATLAAPPVLAETWGPDIGSSLPDGLTARTTSGESVDLTELAAAKNGLVVAFVRSADWCPFCKRQLIDLSKRSAEFDARELTLVSVSYDDHKTLAEFEKQFDIRYALLSDKDSVIIDAFGIRNERHKPGSAGAGIPHPGIMVFDSNGTLVHKFAEKDYKNRPEVDDVLATIDARS